MAPGSKDCFQAKETISTKRRVFGSSPLSSQFQGGSKINSTAGRAPVVLPNQNFEPKYTNSEYNNELAYIRNNPGELTDFNISPGHLILIL